jgi:quinol monooxygenase YgiN
MKIIIIRYKVKPEAAAENEEALKKVFTAIEKDKPQGVRYTSCKQADGVSFVALVQLADGASPLNNKEYFKEFQAGLMPRLAQQPVQEELQVVGSYNFFE